MADAHSKRCTKCGESKPLTEFHRRTASIDGLAVRCKCCASEVTRARNAANPQANRDKAAAWQKTNKEKRKIIRDRWVANNLEKMRVMRKAWKEANPEKVRAEAAARLRANPDIRAANESRRRAKKAAVGGSFTAQQIRELYGLQRGCCAICTEKLGAKFHRDHITPIALGGGGDISNIQLLCPSCNCRKSAKDPIEHAQAMGRLL